MVDFFTCLVDKDFCVWWDRSTSCLFHSYLKEKAKLADVTLVNRPFVGIEILPKRFGMYSRRPLDWKVVVDDSKTLPKWYINNEQFCKSICWLAWAESVKSQLALPGKHLFVKDGFAVAAGGTVTAEGSSLIHAFGSSIVWLKGDSECEAGDSAKVYCSENANVMLFDNARKKVVREAFTEIRDKTSSV